MDYKYEQEEPSKDQLKKELGNDIYDINPDLVDGITKTHISDENGQHKHKNKCRGAYMGHTDKFLI